MSECNHTFAGHDNRHGYYCITCGITFDEHKAATGQDMEIMDNIARRHKGEPLARDMTKRERFAMAAMQGMLACPTCSGNAAEFARNAVEHADALISALEVEK